MGNRQPHNHKLTRGKRWWTEGEEKKHLATPGKLSVICRRVRTSRSKHTCGGENNNKQTRHEN